MLLLVRARVLSRVCNILRECGQRAGERAPPNSAIYMHAVHLRVVVGKVSALPDETQKKVYTKYRVLHYFHLQGMTRLKQKMIHLSIQSPKLFRPPKQCCDVCTICDHFRSGLDPLLNIAFAAQIPIASRRYNMKKLIHTLCCAVPWTFSRIYYLLHGRAPRARIRVTSSYRILTRIKCTRYLCWCI